MRDTTKKVITLILALVMLTGAVLPLITRAADNGKVTVTDTVADRTYDLYRVFDLSYSGETGPNNQQGAYTYTAVSAELEKIIKDDTNLAQLDSGRVAGIGRMIINTEVLVDNNNAINEGLMYDLAARIYDETGVLTKQGEQQIAASDNQEIVFDNLPLGYYMVKSSGGSIVSLDSTATEVTVRDKNINPELQSKVSKTETFGEESANHIFMATNTEYYNQMTVDIPQYANNDYTITTVLSPGVDYVDGSAKVDIAGTDYTTDNVTYNEGTRTLTITIPRATIIENRSTTDVTNTITVDYRTKLNNNAAMSNTTLGANTHTSKLQYGPVDTDVTAEVVTNVYTADFQINKYAGDITNLAGAVFSIKDGEGTVLSFAQNGDNYVRDDNGDLTQFTTTDNANLVFEGLDLGTYNIEEITAPEGYNKLQGDVTLTISETTDEGSGVLTSVGYATTYAFAPEEDIAVETTGVKGNVVEIENKTGTELPSTGGMGRTMIYTAGGILFLGSLVLLIARKRTEEEQ